LGFGLGFAWVLCLGWLAGSGFGLGVFVFRVPASVFRVPGSGLRASGLRASGLRVRGSGFGPAGSRVPAPGFGLPVRTEGTFRPMVRASARCLVTSLVSASR